MIKKKIIDRIQKEKKGISLQEFICICLYDKDGYYKISNPLGKSGDFTTSPEISQLFGEIIGLYIYIVWEEKFRNKLNLIELGPGKGTMLTDILRITKSFPNFHNLLNVHLVEKNNYLINKQKQNLKSNKFKYINFNWQDDFSNIDQKTSVIIANEFFDCLPIRQFKKNNNQWYEKVINFNKKKNIFFYQYLLVNDEKISKRLMKHNEYDIVELSEYRENYFRKICQFIAKSCGLIIVIDYGYYTLLNNFTLQSVFNHQYSNLFDNLGKQDITSFVDFKIFINIAKECNLNVDTFCSQKEFLLANGVLERKNKIIKNSTDDQKKIIQEEYNRLIDNKQMGSIFKFLILSSKATNAER